MENLLRDIKHGLGSLQRDKGFSATVMLAPPSASPLTLRPSPLSIRSCCGRCRASTPTPSY